MIDSNSHSHCLDIFATDDSLVEFLGVYDDLPHYHHNHGFPYCLNVEAYFGKNIELESDNGKNIELENDNWEITHEFPQPLDAPQQSNLLVSDTIDIKMDPYNDEKIIKIRKCLNNDEHSEYLSLLHEFLKIFTWIYLDMPDIDPKIVTHKIVLILEANPVKQKFRKMNPKIALLVKVEIEKLLEDGFICWH